MDWIKSHKKLVLILLIAAVILISGGIITRNIIMPQIQIRKIYASALTAETAGKISEALGLYMEAGDYKDARARANQLRLPAEKEQLPEAKVGETVLWGVWAQASDGSDAPLEWIVLAREDDKILLLTKKILYSDVQYNNKRREPTTWASSDMRNWLNSGFLEKAFLPEEKACIPQVTVHTPDNAVYGTRGGEDTVDQVFLLSAEEVEQYMPDKESRIAGYTDLFLARAQVFSERRKGLSISDPVRDLTSPGYYILRTPGASSAYVAEIDREGNSPYDQTEAQESSSMSTGYSLGLEVYQDPDKYHKDPDKDPYDGNPIIRPALWIDLGLLK